jgi:DNA-binding beta-propeller fold protein YncE
VELVLVGDGSVYRAGNLVAQAPRLGGSVLAATPDGSKVISLSGLVSLDYSGMAGGTVFVSAPTDLVYSSGGNPTDRAVSPDGSRSYVADGGGFNDVGGRYFCGAFDTTGSFIGALPGGSNYPNNVAVTWDGRVACGLANTQGATVWLHSAGGALLSSYDTGDGLQDRQLQSSADGLVLAGLGQLFVAGTPPLIFVPIGR